MLTGRCAPPAAGGAADPGAAAVPVPPVRPAPGAGPGSAPRGPPEAAAGPAAGRPARHAAPAGLARYRGQRPPRQPEPDHRQHRHRLGENPGS